MDQQNNPNNFDQNARQFQESELGDQLDVQMGVFNQTDRMEGIQGQNRLRPSSPALQAVNQAHHGLSSHADGQFLQANQENVLEGQNQNPDMQQSLMNLDQPQMQNQLPMNVFGEWENIGYTNYQNQPEQRVENIQDRIIREQPNAVITGIQSNNALQTNQSLQQVLLQDGDMGQDNMPQYNLNEQQLNSEDLNFQLQPQQPEKKEEPQGSIPSKNQTYERFSEKEPKPDFLKIQAEEALVIQEIKQQPKYEEFQNGQNQDQKPVEQENIPELVKEEDDQPAELPEPEAVESKPQENTKSPKRERKAGRQSRRGAKSTKQVVQPEPEFPQVEPQSVIELENDKSLMQEDPTDPNKPFSDKEFSKAMQKIKDRMTGNQPPKKPASAYILYQKEKRAEILRRKPYAKVTEVVKEIAQCWQQLTKEERMPFKERARKDKDRYDKQIKLLETFSQSLKKPKKCLSAYMIFVKETRPSIVIQYPQLGALDIMKKVGESWQSLQREENGTKYFQDKADQDKMRYLKEQKEFYDEVERIHRQSESKQMFVQDDEEGSESDKDREGSNQLGEDDQSEEKFVMKQPTSKNEKQKQAQKQKQEINQVLVLNQESSKIGKRKQSHIIQLSQQEDTDQLNFKLINKTALHNDIMDLNHMESSGLQKKQKLEQNFSGIIIDRKDSTNPENQGNLIPILAKNSKKQEEVLKPPKKPQTAYTLFLNDFKQKIKEQGKNDKNFEQEGLTITSTQQQISKVAQEKWKTISQDEKTHFSNLAKDDKSKYQEVLKQYEANLASQSKVTEQQEDAFSIDNQSDSENKAAMKEAPELKQRGKPRLKKSLKKDGKKAAQDQENLALTIKKDEFENEPNESQQQNSNKEQQINSNLIGLINPQLLQQMGQNQLQAQLLPYQGLQPIQNQHILNMPNFLDTGNVMNENPLDNALSGVDLAGTDFGNKNENSQGIYGRDRSRPLLEYDKINKLEKLANEQSYNNLEGTDRLEPIDALAGGDGIDLDASGMIGNNKKHIIQIPNQPQDKEGQNNNSKRQNNSNPNMIDGEVRQNDNQKSDQQMASFSNNGMSTLNMQNLNQMQNARSQLSNSQMANFNSMQNQQALNNAAQNLQAQFQQGRVPELNRLMQIQNMQGLIGNSNFQNVGMQLQQQNQLGMMNGQGGINLNGINCTIGNINGMSMVQNQYLNALNNQYLNINSNARVLTPTTLTTGVINGEKIEKPQINTQNWNNEALNQQLAVNNKNSGNGQEEPNDGQKDQSQEGDKQKNTDKNLNMNNKTSNQNAKGGNQNASSQTYQQSPIDIQPQDNQLKSQQVMPNQFQMNQQQQMMNGNMLLQGNQQQQQQQQLNQQLQAHQAFAEQTKFQLQQRIAQQQQLQQQLLIHQQMSNQCFPNSAQQTQTMIQQQSQMINQQQQKIKMMNEQQMNVNQNQSSSKGPQNQVQQKMQMQQQNNKQFQQFKQISANSQQPYQQRSAGSVLGPNGEKDGFMIQQQSSQKNLHSMNNQINKQYNQGQNKQQLSGQDNQNGNGMTISDMYSNNYIMGQQQNLSQLQMQQMRGMNQKKTNQDADNFLSMAAGSGFNAIGSGGGQNPDQNNSSNENNNQRKISTDNNFGDGNQQIQADSSNKQPSGQLIQQLIPQGMSSSQQSQFHQSGMPGNNMNNQGNQHQNIGNKQMMQFQNPQQNQQQLQSQMMQINQQANFGMGSFDMRIQNGQKNGNQINQMQGVGNGDQFGQMQVANALPQQFVHQQLVSSQGYHPMNNLGGFNNFNMQGLNSQIGLNQISNFNMGMSMNMGLNNISQMGPNGSNGQNQNQGGNNNGNGGNLQNINQQMMDKQLRPS